MLFLCCSGHSQSTPEKAAAPVVSTVSSVLSKDDQALAEAKIAYLHGKFELAIQKYSDVLKSNPSSGDAAAGLARVYLKQEKVDDALAAVNKGLVAAGQSSAIHTALGEVYFRQGKITEADKEFVLAANSPQHDARAYLGLARVARSLSLYKRSKNMLDMAHKMDPSDTDISKWWSGTLSRAERIEFFQQYLAGETNDDPEELSDTRHYLEYLKARQAGPHHNCRLATKVESSEVALEPLLSDPRYLRGFGLVVSFNGKKSKLLLDTGASGILINRRLAEKADVKKLSASEIRGIGDKGGSGGWIGFVDSITVGGLEFRDCPVEVSDKRSVADEDGLIGSDVFDSFLVDIDFPKRKLRLEPLPKRLGEEAAKIALKGSEDDAEDSDEDADGDDSHKDSPKSVESAKSTDSAKPRDPPTPSKGPQDAYIAPEMRSFTKIFRFGHCLLIPTRLEDSPPKLFLIDTGAFNNTLAPQAAREVTKVHGDDDITVTGLSGKVKKVFTADKAVIQFGHLRQENRDTVTFDISHISKSMGTEVSGILGFGMLGMLDIKIDYRDGLVDFTYVPNPWLR